VPQEHEECYLRFAQYVCAAAEYAEGWVFFKIRLAQLLLDSKRASEANAIIEELEQMLPNDPEVVQLRSSERNALNLALNT
jgi:uncharacterized protein HemY